nr:NADH dehydrogenase subunit 6 [Coptodryas elegans]
MLLLTLNCMISLLLIVSKNPLSKGFMLLILTITTSLSSSMMFMNSWFGYILFLIMVGGMLVAFIYMTSVASNEKFEFPKTQMIIFMQVLIMMMFIFMYIYMPDSMMNQSMISYSQEHPTMMNMYLSKIFSFPMNQLPIALMSYLFLTLIMVVKMTDFIKGPIRQK